MAERHLLKQNHDFTFVGKADEEGVNKFTCKNCGVKADSKTLYVMDREECRKPESQVN